MDVKFKWKETHRCTFMKLKDAIIQAPTPRYPDTTKPYIVYMDASDDACGAQLSQMHNETPTVKETKKQPPLETNLNKDNTPRTEVSKDTTSNSCKDNPKDTSIKEMQSTDPFCKHIMKRLLNRTAPKHELNTFFIHNGLLYRYASDHSKDFCALVIPKAWRYTILVETHDKMRHQGNNRMYSLIKRQYYWKGMAKDVKDYIQ